MTPEKALAKVEKDNKDKDLQAYLDYRRTFTTMVYYSEKFLVRRP